MAVTKFMPKVKPTNRDLQDQTREVHQCLHQVDDKVKLALRQNAAISQALGIPLPTDAEIEFDVPLPKVSRRVGGLKIWQAICGGGAAIVAGMSTYKVIEPAVIAFAVTLHKGLMTFNQ